MKANAPEKLYLQSNSIAEAGKRKLTLYKVSNDDIKYIRADAFSTKARKWFEEHFGNRLKWEITTYEFEDMQNMFENFRKYMEE